MATILKCELCNQFPATEALRKRGYALPFSVCGVCANKFEAAKYERFNDDANRVGVAVDKL